jgi:FKBP-type peptidyl-prolyl cis-trans isomerase
MIKSFLRSITLGALFLSLAAHALKLDTDKKKASYAIGQQISQSFKAQNVDVDVDVLAASIKDALAGKKPQLTPEQMNEAMQKLQASQMKARDALGAKNLKEGQAFLAANKKKDGVKETKSGLQYKVLREGKGASPKPDDTVSAHYAGTLIDGTEFDSSYKRGEPTEFPVKGVIPGWTEALLTMKPGEKRQLFIPASLAYGPQGRPSIPPNSVLLFDIELMKVIPSKSKK